VVEQRPFKPLVVGSTPTAPTNINRHFFFFVVLWHNQLLRRFFELLVIPDLRQAR
jgi:hypothetical protein